MFSIKKIKKIPIIDNAPIDMTALIIFYLEIFTIYKYENVRSGEDYKKNTTRQTAVTAKNYRVDYCIRKT